MHWWIYSHESNSGSTDWGARNKKQSPFYKRHFHPKLLKDGYPSPFTYVRCIKIRQKD